MRYKVTLHTEQTVTAEVEAPEGATEKELTELVLLQCDAEEVFWETETAWADVRPLA